MEFLWERFKIRRPNFSVLNFEKSLMIATFLGGITIGVLTFLFQIDEEKLPQIDAPFVSNSGDYKGMLIFVTGIAGTLLILSVFAIKVVLVDNRKGNEGFSIIALLIYEAGFCVLAILLPLLVYPFSRLGAFIISLIEVGWFIIFIVYKRSKPSVHLMIDRFHGSSDNSSIKCSKLLNQVRAL
jgi:hypothetical protein